MRLEGRTESAHLFYENKFWTWLNNWFKITVHYTWQWPFPWFQKSIHSTEKRGSWNESSCSTTFQWLENIIASNFSLFIMTDSNFDARNHKCKIGDNSSQLKALSHRCEKHAWSFHTGRFLTLESWITASELQVL